MIEQNVEHQSQRAVISRRDMLRNAGIAGAGLAGLALVGRTSTADAAAMPLNGPAQHLSKAMRKLWEDHITWTRMYIVSFAAGLPDTNLVAARLLRNQVDIGNAIKPYYGAAAGNHLTALLKAHILGAVAILEAAKAGNAAKLAQAKAAWYANGNQIAAFLHSANPMHWPLAAMRRMMRRHLDLTLTEAVNRLQGHYSADIAAYDRVHLEILQMADMLTAGIVAQFPQRF